MKYHLNIVAACIILMLTACHKEKVSKDGVLFPECSITNNVNEKTKLSSVFTKYRIVNLQTTDESLVGGRANKIIKSSGRFYIKSDKEILIFGNDGQYLSKLSRFGMGPEEYKEIYDFDVVPDKDEIWISTIDGLYRYVANSGEFKGKIKFDFYINAFKYIGKDQFIAKTPDDKVYKICDTDGNVLQSFFDKDLANSAYKPVNFIEINGLILDQLLDSDDAVCYDPDNQEFSMIKIIPNNGKLTTAQLNREYYERYGYRDQLDKLYEAYIGIGAFRAIGDQMLMTLQYPGAKWGLTVKKGSECKTYTYYPVENGSLINDILPKADPRMFNTMICTESPDSFIFICISDDDESNPLLLEVFSIQ